MLFARANTCLRAETACNTSIQTQGANPHATQSQPESELQCKDNQKRETVPRGLKPSE